MRKEAAGVKFYIKRTRLGYSAVLLDQRGRSINLINGDQEDSESSIRRAARSHWPNVREVVEPVLRKIRRDPAQHDKRYTTRHRFPKWNIEPTVLQEHRLMKREFPEMTKTQHIAQANEFHRKAAAVETRHSNALTAGSKKYGEHWPMLSGGYYEDWPVTVKDKIRKLAHEMTFLYAAAEAHWRASGKRVSPPWRR